MQAMVGACARAGVQQVFAPHLVAPKPPRILGRKVTQDTWVNVRADVARELVSLGWSVLRVGVALSMSTEVVELALANRGDQ
jgi:hypothetical protein